MKRTITCLSVLLCLAACSEKFEISQEQETGMVFSATMNDTKVGFGERSGNTIPLLWKEGDCISVNGAQSDPLGPAQAGRAVAKFSVNTIEAAEYTVVYPAAAYNGETVTLPAWQSNTPDGEPQAAIIAGRSSSTDVSMNNFCAFVKLTVCQSSSETIRTIKLFSCDKTPMSGDFTLDFSGQRLVAGGNNQAVAYVSNESGMPYSEGKVSVVVCVPSGTYPKGFAIAASTTDGAQMALKSYGNGLTLQPGELVIMPQVTFADDGVAFSGGNGTQGSPYILRTAEDLKTLSDMSNSADYDSVKDAWFEQEADIDLSSFTSFMPVCNTESRPFAGHYEGNGFKVSGLHNGGLFGFCGSCTVQGISLAGNVVSSTAKTGLLAGTLKGGNYINIYVYGSVSGTTQVGGLAGYIDNTEAVVVKGCSSYADVTATSCYAGGIAGHVRASAPALMDRCAAYGSIKAEYAAGGIAGLSIIPTSNPPQAKIAYTNCLYSGRLIEVTGNYGENGNGMAGGIVGWLRNMDASASSQQILNCVTYIQKITYASNPNGKATLYPCCGGIVGLQDKNLNGNTVQGCYSDFKLCRLYRDEVNMTKLVDNCNEAADNVCVYYGGIYGKSSTALVYNHCYFDNSTKMGPGYSSLTAKTDVGQPGNYSSLVTKLNAFVSSYSGEYELAQWEKDARGCVVPLGMTTDCGGRMPLRISVIGDSISTFRSWIPINYKVYYWDNRAVDSKTSDVTWEKTYWGALATRFFDDAIIEKNIAWSGSCTSNCDDQSKTPGFTTRFADSGIGAPDVVLIHGGTNDWNRNLNADKPNVDNTEGFSYSQYVTDAAMNRLFNADINDLDTKCYLDSYVKLVRMIHAENPQAKIVCVIGDRPDLAMVDGVKRIADHYDFCRYSDFRTRGYNTLPKFSGSHPTAAGHAIMASEIYSNHGNWLENN